MQKPTDHLKRYADRYRLCRGEDGIWNIQTRHRERDDLNFDVYLYSNTHLAACLPPAAGSSLLRLYPDRFVLHQDPDDVKVLLFEEEYLDDLAEVLKLRKKRRVSEAERRRLAEVGRKFRFATA